MSQVKSRPRKTVEDYLKLPEGVRAELIEGELFMSPSPKDRHQRVLFNLALELRLFVKANRLGEVWIAPFDVHLPTGDVVQPDIIFVAEGNSRIVQGWIRGVPDLLVEVVSPESQERDRVVKRDRYARNGVKEYWIVDEKGVEVLALSGDQYLSHGYFEAGDRVTSLILKGLSLPVQAIFV